jgi:mannose-6-phosphate isomerase-like protein (cupin superfamily)
MNRIVIILALALSVVAAEAQNKAPAQVYSGVEIQHQLQQLATQAKEKGSSGATLGDFGSHALKLSVRTSSGGAEIHAHFDDVIVVTQGTATLVTGGALVDSQTGSGGESTGTSIRDGVSQSIVVGDIVHVPAGTPHQLLIPKGTLFSALVVKIKE